MRKILLVGLVLVLGFAFFAGCAPKPAPPTTPTEATSPAATPTEMAGSPAESVVASPVVESPGVATPPVPPTMMRQIEYLKAVTLEYASKPKAAKADFKEARGMMLPRDTQAVALVIKKDTTAPKGKTLEVSLFSQTQPAPLSTKTVTTAEVEKGDVSVMLGKEGTPLAPGPYRVEILDKEANKKDIMPFAIGPMMPPPGMRPGMKPGMPGSPMHGAPGAPPAGAPAGAPPVGEPPAAPPATPDGK